MAARSTRNEAAEWQTLLDLGFLWAARDLDRTGEYHRQALAVARQIADPAIFARSLNRIGNWHLNLEQLAEARRYHAQALTIFERLNDPRGLAETHDLLGMTSYIQGDLLQAALHYGRASALFKELGDRRGIGGTAELLMACAGMLLKAA